MRLDNLGLQSQLRLVPVKEGLHPMRPAVGKTVGAGRRSCRQQGNRAEELRKVLITTQCELQRGRRIHPRQSAACAHATCIRPLANQLGRKNTITKITPWAPPASLAFHVHSYNLHTHDRIRHRSAPWQTHNCHSPA